MTTANDAAAYRGHAETLADLIEASLAPWTVRCVERRCADAGVPFDQDARELARKAGEACRSAVAPQVRALLLTDPDEQAGSPLAILRAATRYATEVLGQLGVPPVDRDEFAERSFPADRYDLAPATFGDVDPALHEPGLVWGAAKAHIHLSRRRGEGRR